MPLQQISNTDIQVATTFTFSNTQFGLGSAASPSIAFTGDTNTGIFSPAADTLAFAEGGVEAMRINSSGNIGIGTASPNYKLEVSGTLGVESSGTNIVAGVSTLFEEANRTRRNRLEIGGDSSGAFLNANWVSGGTGVMRFQVESTERMRIDSSGRALIGTASANGSSLLQVNSDALISGLTVGKGNGAAGFATAFGYQALNATNTGSVAGFGYQALYSNTSGEDNTAVGSYRPLYSNTTGSYNSALGRQALQANTTGNYNTGLGMYALYSNTTASNQTAVGYQAGYSNQTSTSHAALLGYQAGYSNTSGDFFTAIGFQAAYSNTSGRFNTALGKGALYTNSTSNDNTAIGNAALNLATAGGNTAVGSNCLGVATTGASNTGVGNSALTRHTTGSFNVGIGQEALAFNTTGSNNTAVGYSAGLNMTTGFQNTCIGESAGSNVTTGVLNTYVGSKAGGNAGASTGQRNVAVGDRALGAITTGNNNIGFGFTDSVNGYSPVFDPTTESNRVVMGHVAITNAYIRVAWTVTSDARDKTNIVDLDKGLAFVQQLQPKQYQFKTSRTNELPSGNVRYGFLAQDILALEGDSPVIVDNEDLNHLKYNGEALVPVLVKAIQELKAEVDSLKQQLNGA
jgi:hypothetical protein